MDQKKKELLIKAFAGGTAVAIGGIGFAFYWNNRSDPKQPKTENLNGNNQGTTLSAHQQECAKLFADFEASRQGKTLENEPELLIKICKKFGAFLLISGRILVYFV